MLSRKSFDALLEFYAAVKEILSFFQILQLAAHYFSSEMKRIPEIAEPVHKRVQLQPLLILVLLFYFAFISCSKQHSSGAKRMQEQTDIGRFVQITDIHIDPYYPYHQDSAMSRRSKPHNRFTRNPSKPTFGSQVWDSPWYLIDETFRYLRNGFLEEVDFLLWTGDNARQVLMSITN
jgi:hypothetical protein